MLRLEILNVGGTEEVADYIYKVFINRRLIASGEVKEHFRADGWEKLVARITKQEISRRRARAR